MAANQSGWNRPSGAAKPVQKKSGSSALVKGLVAGLLVIAGVLVAFYFTRGTTRPVPKAEKSTKAIKQADSPKVARAAKSAVSTNATVGSSHGLLNVENRSALPQTREKIAPPAPLADVIEKIPKPKRLFGTATESYLAMAIPSSPGAGIPPIPISEDEDFTEDMKKAFKTPVVAEDDDDESDIQTKIAVLDHKNELQELAEKEGWTLQQYVNAVRDKYIADGDYIAECYETVEKAYADTEVSDESYIAIRDKVNATLKERGLPEVLSSVELAAKYEEESQNDSKSQE